MRDIFRKMAAVITIAGLLFLPLGETSVVVLAKTDTELQTVKQHCEIISWDEIELEVEWNKNPTTDDQKLYVCELNTFEYDVTKNVPVIGEQDASMCVSFHILLNHGKSNTRLYKKFVVAGIVNGKMEILMEPQYISNPEFLAQHTKKRPKTTSKKGLMLDDANAKDLGVQHFITNMYVDSGECMTNILDQKGVKNVVVLNKWSDNKEWINPLARDNPKAYYYMFNASDQESVNKLAKAFQTYALAYQYDNWIIGNEINARNPWNYMQYMPVEQYTREYYQAFRVMYTTIKSINANAEVFISLDQNWDRNLPKEKNIYDAKDVLDCFNNLVIAGGNIDYGVAYHPYPVPLYWAKVWDTTSLDKKYSNMIKDTYDSPMVSFQNLHVLTDYLKQPQYLNAKGDTRKVILSEIGLNANQGEDVQAAALAYAYVAAESNDMVESIIFSRGKDIDIELKDNMAFGLYAKDGRERIAYQVFKYMDTPSFANYNSYAKSIIGIEDWNQVIINADIK